MNQQDLNPPGFQLPQSTASMYGSMPYDATPEISLPQLGGMGDFGGPPIRSMPMDDSLANEPAMTMPGPSDTPYLMLNSMPMQAQPMPGQTLSSQPMVNQSQMGGAPGNMAQCQGAPPAYNDADMIQQYRKLQEQRRQIDEAMSNLSLKLNTIAKQGKSLPSDIATSIGPYKQTTAPSSHGKASSAATRYWTADEHALYLEAVELYGEREIKRIAAHVATRNPTQVRTHQQKYQKKLKKIFEAAKTAAEQELLRITPRIQAYEAAMAAGQTPPESLWRLLGALPEALVPPADESDGGSDFSTSSRVSSSSRFGSIRRDELLNGLLSSQALTHYSTLFIKHSYIEFALRSADHDPQKARLSRIAEHMYKTVEDIRDILHYLSLLDNPAIMSIPKRRRTARGAGGGREFGAGSQTPTAPTFDGASVVSFGTSVATTNAASELGRLNFSYPAGL